MFLRILYSAAAH